MSTNSTSDNRSEYEHPDWYDAENRWGPDDDFFLALAQRLCGQGKGPVLDVACGTGRLTRALAAAGLHVTGVDCMAPMLQRAKALAADLPIQWVQADCRTMQLGQHFPLVLMTSHAFQQLLTDADQAACLTTIREHLEPGGRFAFEIRNPGGLDWHDSDWFRWRTFTDAAGQSIETWMRSTYDQPALLERVELRRVDVATGAAVESTTTLRYTDVEQLNLRLAAHGFTVIEQYGNWLHHPVLYESPEIITICQRGE